MGLHAPGWLYVLEISPRADLLLWTPRARATDLGDGPNLRAGSGPASWVPQSREREERPAAGREKHAERQKNTVIDMYFEVYILCWLYVKTLTAVWWSGKLILCMTRKIRQTITRNIYIRVMLSSSRGVVERTDKALVGAWSELLLEIRHRLPVVSGPLQFWSRARILVSCSFPRGGVYTSVPGTCML